MISVMLQGRNLWQSDEHLRNAQSPMWKVVDSSLYRHGQYMPDAYLLPNSRTACALARRGANYDLPSQQGRLAARRR